MGEFSHPLFLGPLLSFFFLSLKYWLALLHCYKNSPPISKSWIRTCSGHLVGIWIVYFSLLATVCLLSDIKNPLKLRSHPKYYFYVTLCSLYRSISWSSLVCSNPAKNCTVFFMVQVFYNHSIVTYSKISIKMWFLLQNARKRKRRSHSTSRSWKMTLH